ncbi:MAG: FtsX-like permease family protein [Candidatus Bathyarchaeia archaeon]
MKFIDILRLSSGALMERKVRAALTILMVVIGASLVTALRGMTAGTYEYVVGQFGLLGANVVIVLPASSSFRVTETVRERLARVDNVVEAVPFIQNLVLMEAHGETRQVPIIGIDQSKLSMIFPSVKISQGRLVTSQDSTGILLGYSVAYPSGESKPFTSHGESVTIYYNIEEDDRNVLKRHSFRVKGILEYVGTSTFFIPIDRMASIPLTAANSLFEKKGVYDGIFLVVEDQNLVDEVVKDTRRIYTTSLEIYSAKTIIQTAENVMSSIELMMSGVAAVSLIVASIGILASLYTSVLERIKEIGLLKALGFRNRSVMGLFLGEAAIVGVIGGTIGNIFGVLLAHVLSLIIGKFREQAYTELFAIPYTPPIFKSETFIYVWIFTLVLSILSGVYPAWRAARLDPVEALRRE